MVNMVVWDWYNKVDMVLRDACTMVNMVLWDP